MLFFVFAYFATDTHPSGEKLHQLIVHFVDLTAQLGNAFCRHSLITDDKQRKDIIQHIGGHLLRGIAPSLIGRAMTLHYQPVEAKIHCLLAQRGYQLAAATDMTWVAYHRQARQTAVQLNRYLPHRHVAVNLLAEA